MTIALAACVVLSICLLPGSRRRRLRAFRNGAGRPGSAPGGEGGRAAGIIPRLRAAASREVRLGRGSAEHVAATLGRFVDALVTCVEAGLPLESAIDTVLACAGTPAERERWPPWAETIRAAARAASEGDDLGTGGLGATGSQGAAAVSRRAMVPRAGKSRVWPRPGANATEDPPGLSLLGGAVGLSSRTGAPLGPALRAVRGAVRDQVVGAGRARVLAAGPTATMIMLSALPLLGPLAIWALGWRLTEIYSGVSAAIAFAGLLATAGGWLWARQLIRRAARPTRLDARTDRPGDASLPEVADAMLLLALALGTGAGITESIEEVARLRTGRVAADLRVAAAARRWGCAPGAEWVMAGSSWHELSLAWMAADRAGAAPARLVMATSARLMEREQQALEERLQRAGVLLVLPLGACFLPGFVMTTVLPAVLVLAARLA